MTRYTAGLKAAALALALAAMLSGCFLFGAGKEKPEGGDARSGDDMMRQERFRTRPPISSRRNLYEGSLWRGAASWGNLMRDHRARYRGDLLTVTDMPKIINLPEPLPEGQQEQQQQQQQQQQQNVDPVIAFLKEQERRRDLIDKEQTEILRSIETIEVEVVRVLPNGNLLVRGVHPPIFRSRNRVKYVVTLRGIVRPTDVDDKNQVPAPKISKADYKIRRLVRRSAIAQRAASAAAKAGGKQEEAGVLGRLSNFLSGTRGQ